MSRLFCISLFLAIVSLFAPDAALSKSTCAEELKKNGEETRRYPGPDIVNCMATLEAEINALKARSSVEFNVWESEWFGLDRNSDRLIQHNLGTKILSATIWYRKKGSDQVHLMDGVFEGAGWGAWLMNFDSDSMLISAGANSATSGYGRTSHYDAIDRPGPNYSQPRELKIVIVYQRN